MPAGVYDVFFMKFWRVVLLAWKNDKRRGGPQRKCGGLPGGRLPHFLIALFVFILPCAVQSFVHRVDVPSATDKLYPPHDGKDEDENPEILKESRQGMLHPVREVCNRHHDDGIDEEINSSLFYDAPMFDLPYDGGRPEADAQQGAECRLQDDRADFAAHDGSKRWHAGRIIPVSPDEGKDDGNQIPDGDSKWNSQEAT